MVTTKTAMEIFRLLDQSNCRECGKKTCLAFAGAVHTGQKKLSDCPKLNGPSVAAMFETVASDNQADAGAGEGEGERALKDLIDQTRQIDFTEASDRIGAQYSNDRLTLKIFGKEFALDNQGRIITDIHVNPWVAVPFLTYLLRGKGTMPNGNWVSFREFQGGQERYPLFRKRCETAIKTLADRYPGFFEDIIDIFNGRQVDEQFASDISVVLDPLPRIPIMLCYWKPEDGMGSSFNLYFDETANHNLDIEALFTLGVGLAQMFEKLAMRHGW